MHYLDTSALVKLVVAEPESAAMWEWMHAPARVAVTSDLARTELLRATRRVDGDLVVRARLVLDVVTMVQIPTSVFHAAGRLDPVPLRSLDALHIATALELGDGLVGLVTYDDRLAAAARANGIPVDAPT